MVCHLIQVWNGIIFDLLKTQVSYVQLFFCVENTLKTSNNVNE